MQRAGFVAVVLAVLFVAALILVRPVLALAVTAAAALGLAVGGAIALRRGRAVAAPRGRRAPNGWPSAVAITVLAIGALAPLLVDSGERPPPAAPLASTPAVSVAPETRSDVPSPLAELEGTPSPHRSERDRTTEMSGYSRLAPMMAGGSAGPPDVSEPTPLPVTKTIATGFYSASVEYVDGRMRVKELFRVTGDVLGRGKRRAQAIERLEEQAPPRGWEVTRTVEGVQLDRTRVVDVRLRGLPHFLTANRIALGKLRWSPAEGKLIVVTPIQGSALTLRTPRRMVVNTNQAATFKNVPGDEAETRLELEEDAAPDGPTYVEFDLANGMGRSQLYSTLRAMSLWSGIGWLLSAVVTAAVAATASVLVPRYLARRSAAAEPARAPA